MEAIELGDDTTFDDWKPDPFWLQVAMICFCLFLLGIAVGLVVFA